MFDETIASRVRPLAEAFLDAALVRLTVREDDFELEFRRAESAPAMSAGTYGAAAEGVPAAAARPPEVLTSDVVGVVRFIRPPALEGQRLEGDRDLAFV